MSPAYSDPELLNTTLKLAKDYNIDTFIETGTHNGKNISLLSPHFKDLHTIEIDTNLYNEAVQNNIHNSNISLYNSCSTKILPSILPDSPYIIFLDAHWWEYFPILDELEIIKNKGIEPIIIIHDVYVPDGNKSKFGYDKYGDIILNLEYVQEKLHSIYKNGYNYHFSATSITDSGVLYVYPNIAKNILKNIRIPSWAKKFKIDIGTSLNAPISELWLQNDPELCVIGFEPNPHNYKILKEGQDKWLPHLKLDRINRSFFLIEAALSNTSQYNTFYCTDEGNPGTSSLFKPLTFKVVDTPLIPTITLKDFLDNFPQIHQIDHLKIDAQSSDFNIIKGASNYLREKVVYLTVETNTGQYYNEEHPEEMKNYIESQGFECINWSGNGHFYNKKYEGVLNNVKFLIEE